MKTVQVNINRANKDPINYFTTLGLKHLEFPEGTKKEHINVVIKTEKNEIQVTEDTQLMNIISTTSQMPILIFHTIARPFSSYTFQEASKLFNLKVDSMGECPVYHQGIADLVGMDRYINDTVWDLMCLHRAYGDVSGTNEAQYSVFIRAVLVGIIHTYNPADNYLLLEQKVIMGIYGMGPVDFVIKKGNQFIGVTEAKKEAISKDVETCIIKLSYLRKMKTVQVNINRANKDPINYFTTLGLKHLEFPEGTKKEHINVVIKTEKNEIQVTEDTQLMNIISTTSQMPILIFHTIARPFSSYTFQEASKLFNLKVDSMGECPVYHQGIADLVGMDRYINDTVWDLMCLHRAYGDVSGTNEAQYSVFIRAVLVGIIHTYNPADNYLLLEQKVIMGIYGMGPVDFVIKKGNQFIGVTEAKKEAISK
ncbi:22138_t:CDS:2, partial [Entrophospora sp. SA101]